MRGQALHELRGVGLGPLVTGGKDARAEAGGGLCHSPFEASAADPIKCPGGILEAGPALSGIQVPGDVCSLAGTHLPGIVAALTQSVVLHIQREGAARAPALHGRGLAEQEEAGGCWWG